MAADIATFNTANPGNGSSITVTKPTGLTVGELMIFHYSFTDATDTADTISGWTHEVNNASVGGNRTGLQWKIADSGDVAATNFTISFTGTVANPVAGLVRITGFISSDLLNDSGVLVGNTSSPSFANTITPISTNSLMLFFIANNEGKDTSAYAIATDNPTWSEVYDVQGSTTSAIALAKASRPQMTASGNSSATLAGGSGTVDSYGIMIAIGSVLNATVTPTVMSIVATVQAPSVAAGAGVSPTVITVTATIQTPTVSTPASIWSNQDKNEATGIVNQTKS